jgi:release factor glutamine methyltransferase
MASSCNNTLTPYGESQGFLPWWESLCLLLNITGLQARAELRLWLEFLKLPPIEQLAYVMTPIETARYIQHVWPTWQPLLHQRLQERLPIQYILGEAHFMGRAYYAVPPCLIPRPETELLVEAVAKQYINAPHHSTPLTIWEVGVGSGCISLALYEQLRPCIPQLRLHAGDVCPHALALAERNARRYSVPVTLYRGSLLEAFPPELPSPDVIIANLPYIDEALAATLAPEVLKHEAAHALFAPQEGFALIEALLQQTRIRFGAEWQGYIALEFGEGMAPRLETLLNKNGFMPFQWVVDYAGITRHVLARFVEADNNTSCIS